MPVPFLSSTRIASRVLVLVALLCAPLLAAAISNPTPQRAYVSAAQGNDANNCGQANPCRTIQAALAQVNPGGEVLVLDSGGFGGNSNNSLIYITQSVTITVPNGVYGGISPPDGYNGITINAPGAMVTLRGLSINSQVVSSASGNFGIGIEVVAASSVNIENCIINGMYTAGVVIDTGPTQMAIENTTFHNDHFGLNIGASGTSPAPRNAVTVRNSSFIADVSTPGGAGNDYVHVFAGAGSQLSVDSSKFVGGSFGILALGSAGLTGTAAGAATNVSLVNSVINGANEYGVYLNNGPLRADLRGNFITNTVDGCNCGNGIGVGLVDSAVVVALGGNTITGNVSGVAVSSGLSSPPIAYTLGGNDLYDNGTDLNGITLTTLAPR